MVALSLLEGWLCFLSIDHICICLSALGSAPWTDAYSLWSPSPGEENGNPLQLSCLENSMDRGAWWATVHTVAKSRTQLCWGTNNASHTHLLCPSTPQEQSHICATFGSLKQIINNKTPLYLLPLFNFTEITHGGVFVIIISRLKIGVLETRNT